MWNDSWKRDIDAKGHLWWLCTKSPTDFKIPPLLQCGRGDSPIIPISLPYPWKLEAFYYKNLFNPIDFNPFNPNRFWYFTTRVHSVSWRRSCRGAWHFSGNIQVWNNSCKRDTDAKGHLWWLCTKSPTNFKIPPLLQRGRGDTPIIPISLPYPCQIIKLSESPVRLLHQLASIADWQSW